MARSSAVQQMTTLDVMHQRPNTLRPTWVTTEVKSSRPRATTAPRAIKGCTARLAALGVEDGGPGKIGTGASLA